MKNYKMIRIAGMHSKAAIDDLYHKNPKLHLAPYAQQQQVLFENSYMYSNTFSREMRKLGHWAEEIVYDVRPLQKKWMEEQGKKFLERDWQSQIIISQLSHYQPEVVFFQDIHSLPYDLKASLKKLIPSIKKIVIFRGFPGTSAQLFKELSLADLLLVGSPVLVDKCSTHGLKPHLVYHCFDDSILSKLKMIPSNKRRDFTFIGSSGYGYEAHQDRYQMLLTLLQKTQIELWIDEPNEQKSSIQKIKGLTGDLVKGCLKVCPLNILGSLNKYSFWPLKLKKWIFEEVERKRLGSPPVLKQKPLNKLFSNRCNPPLFGLEMFSMLQQSRVVLNKHSMPAQGTVDNMRLFQATGVGTCLLTDTGSNMSELFEPDQEIVTYSSLEECLEKASYLIEHEHLRRQIAEAGQKRALKDHNSGVRYQQINNLIEKSMKF